jgi:hypothetical protein
MYRVSENGAVWEVQVPHHRSDHMWDDPTHKHTITPGTINLFNRKNLVEGYKIGRSDSPLAFEMNVDMDLCETKFAYVGYWMELLKNKEITEEQLNFALNTQCNVAESTIMLIQVHKPGRYTIEELKDIIKQKELIKLESKKLLDKQ